MKTNEIKKEVFLKAPLERVWKAISSSDEFGTWFGMAFEGPFIAGKPIKGVISGTKVDSEVAKMQAPHLGKKADFVVDRIEPMKLFSIKWHPFGVDPNYDYSKEPMTTVTFTLEPKDGGVYLSVTETGFDKIPISRRADALKANDIGWTLQMELIAKYLAL